MHNQTTSFYNNYSFLYPLVDRFLKGHKRTLMREVNGLLHGKLLEIGVGNGKHLPLYKTHEVVGIDTSSGMLAKAANKKNERINLFQMNGEALLFPDKTFDYVVLCHVIAVVDNPETVLAEAYRVLKPNGQLFILNHFTPNNWLKYIDYALQPISKIFHFKSVFSISSLTNIKKFTLLKQIQFGRHAYFKLLIYSKP